MLVNDPYCQQDVQMRMSYFEKQLQCKFKAVKDHGKCVTAGIWLKIGNCTENLQYLCATIQKNQPNLFLNVPLELKLLVDQDRKLIYNYLTTD